MSSVTFAVARAAPLGQTGPYRALGPGGASETVPRGGPLSVCLLFPRVTEPGRGIQTP